MYKKLIFCGLVVGSILSELRAQTVNLGTAYLGEETVFSSLYSFDNQNGAAFINDGEAYFYNNFNNDGLIDFYDQTGVSIFTGQQPQNLSGSAPGFFNDILFDNSSSPMPFELSGRIEAEGRVSFLNGIVDNRNTGGVFIFGPEAVHFNTSDRSHVNGPVQKVGNEEFIYPIGDDGFYRFAGSGNTANSPLLTGTYFHANSNSTYPHTAKPSSIISINNREYWRLDREGNEDIPQLVTLSYRNATTPQDYIAAAEDDALVIVRWDESDKRWINEGGTVDLETNSISTMVDQFGIFTLAKTEIPEDKCELKVYNLVDVNGASDNKYMRIRSDCATVLAVSVFNRWGVKVFETSNYGQSGDVFDGYSTGRLTVNRSKGLPSGTYFYIIDYEYASNGFSKKDSKVGYVYVNGN